MPDSNVYLWFIQGIASFSKGFPSKWKRQILDNGMVSLNYDSATSHPNHVLLFSISDSLYPCRFFFSLCVSLSLSVVSFLAFALLLMCTAGKSYINKHAYINTCIKIHLFIHQFTHPFIHPWIHPHIYSFIHRYIHTYVHINGHTYDIFILDKLYLHVLICYWNYEIKKKLRIIYMYISLCITLRWSHTKRNTFRYKHGNESTELISVAIYKWFKIIFFMFAL